MYVWTVNFDECWDNSNGEFLDTSEWIVAAEDYDEALAKARTVAMKDREWIDDDEGGDGKSHTIVDVRLTSIQRGDELDA